jgi:hypothetical protein
MGVRLTHDEFVIKITSVHGSAYSVISEYTGSATKYASCVIHAIMCLIL